jgi:hypothetical protein
VVDHINNNPLDNRRENLRILSRSENARNKEKKDTASSQFYGVSFLSNSKKWKASIKIGENAYRAFYNTEEEAAFQYNYRYNCVGGKRNTVTKPENFVEWVSSKGNKSLPKGITKCFGKYRVRITEDKKRRCLGLFTTLAGADDALFAEKLRLSKVIVPTINEDGTYYITATGGQQILVDAENYTELFNIRWLINVQGYATGSNTNINMSRYIMQYTGPDFVDHINGNRIDNRRANLRICTPQQNSRNRTVSSGTSKYVGVRKYGKKWNAIIKTDVELIVVGVYFLEINAAKARDVATKKYFGEYGHLNFPDEVDEKNLCCELHNFLSSKTESKLGATMYMDDFKEKFVEWLGIPIKRLDKKVFKQVNSLYEVVLVMNRVKDGRAKRQEFIIKNISFSVKTELK